MKNSFLSGEFLFDKIVVFDGAVFFVSRETNLFIFFRFIILIIKKLVSGF